MNIIKIFKNDIGLLVFYGAVYALCWSLYNTHPFIQTRKDLSGLYYILVCFIFGIALLICQVVAMVRYQTTVNIKLVKSILMLIYWVACSAIFILLNMIEYTHAFLFFLIIIYIILLWIGIYFSAFRSARLAWKDYGLMLMIFLGLVMTFWGIPTLISLF